jgi:zinc protease
MSALYGQSRYVDRVPIGLPDLIKSFPAQRLRDFYRDNYHPDRMAVIAVGDFDPAAIEALIRQNFSGLAAAPRVARPPAAIPPHKIRATRR